MNFPKFPWRSKNVFSLLKNKREFSFCLGKSHHHVCLFFDFSGGRKYISCQLPHSRPTVSIHQVSNHRRFSLENPPHSPHSSSILLGIDLQKKKEREEKYPKINSAKRKTLECLRISPVIIAGTQRFHQTTNNFRKCLVEFEHTNTMIPLLQSPSDTQKKPKKREKTFIISASSSRDERLRTAGELMIWKQEDITCDKVKAES